MFISQPDPSFGDLIGEELDAQEAGKNRWRTFEFAVAWVNDRGAERIEESARRFLAAGGRIRATVGLDFSSTSYEGLCRLLDLGDGGKDITTHVFFDENTACTFHPKVFLFSNATRACLFVGSNNMTGAGLHTNVEAASKVQGGLESETIIGARKALEGWRDPSREPSRTRPLTRSFLEQLRRRGYVRTEKEIRDRRNAESRSKSSKGEPLFGRSTTRGMPPRRGTDDPKSGRGQAGNPSSGEALLMRVRPRRNGKQLQISMRVHRSAFMREAKEVVSARDGSHRPIGYDYVRRNKEKKANLARFEAPEMEGMTNPVARFRWIDRGDPKSDSGRVLQYEIFDANSEDVGADIFSTLEGGISESPVTDLSALSADQTVISKSNPDSAQWYRLDSV